MFGLTKQDRTELNESLLKSSLKREDNFWNELSEPISDVWIASSTRDYTGFISPEKYLYWEKEDILKRVSYLLNKKHQDLEAVQFKDNPVWLTRYTRLGSEPE